MTSRNLPVAVVTDSITSLRLLILGRFRQNAGRFHSGTAVAFMSVRLVGFAGICTFKTALPANVMNHGYIPYIKSKTNILFSPQEVQNIITTIKTGMLQKTWETTKKHVTDLKERFESTTICLRCSSELILRTVKSGTKAGSSFFGCSKYPSCRYTKSVHG